MNGSGRPSHAYAPLPVDDMVYLTTTRGVLGIYAATGEKAWRSEELGDPPMTGPAYGNGHIYVPAGFRLHAVDEHTGDVEWTFKAGGDIRVVPTVDSGMVYVGARNGRVYALDAESGDQR